MTGNNVNHDLAVEEHFAEAPGSGTAALLAFFHIMVCGILAYASYYLVRYANAGLLASPNLSWQFFIPTGLALALNLPTNPLSRVLGRAAFFSGIVAVLAFLVALGLTLSDSSRQFEQIPTAALLARIAAGVAAAALSSLAARWAAVRLLPQRDPVTE